MATDTLDDFSVTNSWQDIVATVAAAASVDLILQNVGGTNVQVVQGGASQPAATKTGQVLRPSDNLLANNAHVWVRSLGSTAGKISLNPL